MLTALCKMHNIIKAFAHKLKSVSHYLVGGKADSTVIGLSRAFVIGIISIFKVSYRSIIYISINYKISYSSLIKTRIFFTLCLLALILLAVSLEYFNIVRRSK